MINFAVMQWLWDLLLSLSNSQRTGLIWVVRRKDCFLLHPALIFVKHNELCDHVKTLKYKQTQTFIFPLHITFLTLCFHFNWSIFGKIISNDKIIVFFGFVFLFISNGKIIEIWAGKCWFSIAVPWLLWLWIIFLICGLQCWMSPSSQFVSKLVLVLYVMLYR